MSNNKQTSIVQELRNLLEHNTRVSVNWDFYLEMEKQDHHKTWKQCYMSNYQTFEHYYTETFGSNQTPTPDPKLIDSMAMRYRHDFGLLTESEKESIRITMKQIWEETAGLGFYKP